MSTEFGWNRRDEENRRIKIKFKLVREKIFWTFQPARYERWEEFKPSDEDWDVVLETMEKNLRRGKVTPEDVKLVKRLHRDRV